MNKSVIILPYFGALPPYFGTYLKSLEGKNMDVLWISDLEVPHHPDNFKIVRMSFGDIKQRAAKVLGTRVVMNGGRRLCDFRPMYAAIFEEFIREYDYWGWGDCDLVYGKAFNDFLSSTVEAGKYDAVSMHRAFMSGPTCFCRNTPLLRDLYQKAANWREVCAFEGQGGVLIFDECGGEFHVGLSAGTMTLEECSRKRDSFSAILWREPGLKLFREDVICEESLADGKVVKMEDGVLTLDGKEISVYHFNLAKIPHYFRYVNIPYEKVERYRIDRTGFYVSKFALATRCIRGRWRISVAALKSLRKYGLRHVLERLGMLGGRQ